MPVRALRRASVPGSQPSRAMASARRDQESRAARNMPAAHTVAATAIPTASGSPPRRRPTSTQLPSSQSAGGIPLAEAPRTLAA